MQPRRHADQKVGIGPTNCLIRNVIRANGRILRGASISEFVRPLLDMDREVNRI